MSKYVIKRKIQDEWYYVQSLNDADRDIHRARVFDSLLEAASLLFASVNNNPTPWPGTVIIQEVVAGVIEK